MRSRTILYLLLVLLSNIILYIKGQSCQDGNQYQYRSCSGNPQCACFQLSFSSSMFLCGLRPSSCAQFQPCQSSDDACQRDHVCVRHPECDARPLCYPLSMSNEQTCPSETAYETTDTPNRISNYTSALTNTDGFYSRPGGSSNTYYEAIQLYVPTSGYYDLTSISGMDTHGYLYNGTFYPSNPQLNLIAHNDDGTNNNQFKLPVYLQAGIPYTLVVTTHHAGITGPFTVIGDGPDNIYFIPLNPSTTTTTTSITTQTSIINAYFYSGILTNNNSQYDRVGNGSAAYCYQAFEVRVNRTGIYTFTSASSYDTYGYMYQGNFYPMHPEWNVRGSDDDGGSNSNFRLSVELRSDIKYILVFTTFQPSVLGPYSVTASGPGHVSLNPIDKTFS